MSDALSVFTIAASTINALGALAFGATGGVVLGNFSFFGMEVPEFITIGGAQKMTVHTLPGGERIIDLLGHEDRDLEWQGILIDTFQGAPAQRAQMLDQMRLDGPALPLQWGDWYFTVIVREFTAETRFSQLHYRICCTVQVNPAAPTTRPEPTTQDAVSSDLGEAQGAAPDAVKSSTASAQKTLPEPPLDPGTVDAGRVDENLGMGEGMGIGMDTATGETVAATNTAPPTSVGYVDEYGHVQNTMTTLPSQPNTSSPTSVDTVSTEGGLVPAATGAQSFTSSPFIN